jgi:hypothetical protein
VLKRTGACWRRDRLNGSSSSEVGSLASGLAGPGLRWGGCGLLRATPLGGPILAPAGSFDGPLPAEGCFDVLTLERSRLGALTSTVGGLLFLPISC